MKIKKDKRQHGTILTTNVVSTIAGTAAACCSGPGLLACSSTCAPSCGSLLYSIFGISSSAFTTFLSQYAPIFLILSIASFGYAYYKLFLKQNCSTSKMSKAIFFCCLIFSSLMIIRSFLIH